MLHEPQIRSVPVSHQCWAERTLPADLPPDCQDRRSLFEFPSASSNGKEQEQRQALLLLVLLAVGTGV